MNTPNHHYEEEMLKIQTENNQENSQEISESNIENPENKKSSKKKYLVAGAVALASVLGGTGAYFLNKGEKAPEKEKIETIAPEKAKTENSENTITFEEAKEQIKTPEATTEQENNTKTAPEKKLTQDEIDAQEAKERGVDVKWWKERKKSLQKANQKVKDWTKDDIYNIPEARKSVEWLLELYKNLRLEPSPLIKKLEKYLQDREKEQEDNWDYKHIFGEYAE